MNDHFSAQARDYAQFRPTYPQELFDYVFSRVENFDQAWDCGTGNGQTALALSERFRQVTATDLSQNQLDLALRKNNIRYICSRAESTPLESGSIDFITISQALHWFDFERFYREVRRVAKPGVCIAAWCYSWCVVYGDQPSTKVSGIRSACQPACLSACPPSQKINDLFTALHSEILADYWPHGRYYIEERYETIPFPFCEIERKEFAISAEWGYNEFAGYLNSWSATQAYLRARGKSPLSLVEKELQQAWGLGNRRVSWPVYLIMGKVSS